MNGYGLTLDSRTETLARWERLERIYNRLAARRGLSWHARRETLANAAACRYWARRAATRPDTTRPATG